MAATIASVAREEAHLPEFKGGAGLKLGLVKLTGDTSYPTGGYPLVAADFGLTQLLAVFAADTSGGFHPEYDYTNGKLKLRWSAAAGAVEGEVTNTTNVTTFIGYLLAVGR
jgi:hypothetical protein